MNFVRPVFVLVLAALSGCFLGPDTSTPEGRCASESYNDPTVKDIQMRMLATSTAALELRQDLADARQAAMTRCMRAQGLAPPGAVQRPYRPQ